MSNIDVHRKFSEFGNKMNTIAILTIVSLILGIIAWVARFIGFIYLVVIIVTLAFFFSALGNIKEANNTLNNQNLLEYRSKLILAFIFFTIGMFFFVTGIVGLYIVSNAGAILAAIIVFAVFLIIGITFLIIAAVFSIIAWSRLESFFTYNTTLFPQNIGNDARIGANLCKIASILDLTIILTIIGNILRIIGYFKLASLKNSAGAPAARLAPLSPGQPIQTLPATKETTNFCPKCGHPIKGKGDFYPEHGSSIDKD